MELQELAEETIQGGAECVLNLQPASSLSIAYHSNFGPHDDLLLLQLDDKLLPHILNQRVSLRGQPDEDAVLCTQSKTYAIKFVGTSNSVFLIPPSNASCSAEIMETDEDKSKNKMVVASVLKLAPGCMEITEIAPRLDNLRSLLAQNPYSFNDVNEMDEESKRCLYTWDDLVDKIQASDMELQSGLDSLYALEINGYWRIIDDDYKDSILNMLLHNIVLLDWSRNGLNEHDVVNMLESDGFPRDIARHCLKIYADKVIHEGSFAWRLDEKRVGVHFAKRILRNGKMKMGKFMEEWRKNVPEGMDVNFEMLKGEVLTEKIGIESWVYGFSVCSLPSSPAERFDMLFKERAKWEWNDLEPFIRDLQVPGLSSEGLLLKYTRRSQSSMDMEPIFSAR